MRYLSLPGEDLLDVRVLREACEDAGVELRFTGLNAVAAGSARDIQLNIAESEMRGLAGIHDGSAVVRERFETVANAESLLPSPRSGTAGLSMPSTSTCAITSP